jgi:hypothetical protein
MVKIIRRIAVLICLLLMVSLASCSSAAKVINLSREYAGSSENYKVTIDSWAEHNGSKELGGRIKYDENIYCITRFTIEYIGQSDFGNQVISGIKLADSNWNANYYGEPDYTYLFKDNKFVADKKRDLRCIDNTDYFVEFTYDNGSKEIINTELQSKTGEISDLDLDFGQ